MSHLGLRTQNDLVFQQDSKNLKVGQPQLIITDTIIANSGQIGNLTATTGSIDYLTSLSGDFTDLVTNNLIAGSGNITNLVSQTANITNLLASSGNIDNLVVNSGAILPTLETLTVETLTVLSGATIPFDTLTVDYLTVNSGATLPAFESLIVKGTGTSELGTVTSGTWNGNVIDPAYGGTGQSSYNVGDILVADGATSLTTLASGAEGTHLKINGGALAWVPDPIPTSINNNDLLIGVSPNSLTTLASGAEGQVLSVTSGALAWRTEPHPLTFAVGDLLVADSTSTLASLPSGAEGQVLGVVSGSLAWTNVAADASVAALTTVTGVYNVVESDRYVLASGDATVLLPSSAVVGKRYTVKDWVGTASSGAGVTVSGIGGELIDGISTYVLVNDWQSSNFIWNGSSWSVY